jgi:hypothetical protein
MADSNKVFVSPGVYTSEKDLTFVAQSVGVTTLGLVGETLKGPAFEPILITNFDEFRRYFGNSSPAKDGNGNPKYELPYVAKSYLQESNQLFVTRILGLTGYLPYNTFGIKTLGGVQYDVTSVTTDTDTMIPAPSGITSSTYYEELSGKTSVDGTSITDYITTNFSGFTVTNNGTWFTIGLPDSVPTTGTEVVSPYTGKFNADTVHGKEWFNVFYHENGGVIDAVYSYLFVWNGSHFDVTRYEYSATERTEYTDLVVAALRSRGKYTINTLNLEVTGSTSLTLSNIVNSDITSNPFADFVINVTGMTSGAKTLTCSLDSSSTKFITKVLGTEVFDKSNKDFPIYLHEVYYNFLSNAYKQGWVRGLSLDVAYNTDGTNFLNSWDTPISPMVVSEVRGSEVDDLFEVITISDGETGNNEVKISIVNINLETAEFDVLVRDFNDTDENMVVLEKYSRCTMNTDLPGYVGKKIGTSDTEYELRSKYIMLKLNPNHPTDAIPAGFKGYTNNSSFSGCTLGNVIYKTKYYDAGEVIGYEPDGTPITTNGDKVRKVSLGVSTQMGFDNDLLKYKGADASNATKGFHLSVNASTITGVTYDTTPYDLEGQSGTNNKLTDINYRKFTFTVFGGRDGWDIYRNVRTFTDGFIYGKNSYTLGNVSNGGVFNTTNGNSDYYAYIQGMETFSNPEAVDINIFATPGINFYDHSSLTAQAIDMIEIDRADSLYIINAPNLPTTNEIVGAIDTIGLDSNYSATYWPWIQVRDTDNATQLFIPPTGEVCRNIALTDNVSYPWFAVAGYSRGLVKSIKAFKKLTLSERDDLYKNRINPIATFSDTGTIIWGNKTLQIRESALDRMNVRRLLLRARKLISAVAVRLLFEQNDEQVRNEFLRLVNPILESIKKERGLYEFRVVVSNDPEDIDANTLRGKIYIKPTRSLEFIDVEFIITPTGASFENI